MSLERFLTAHPRVADVLGALMFAAVLAVSGMPGAGS